MTPLRRLRLPTLASLVVFLVATAGDARASCERALIETGWCGCTAPLDYRAFVEDSYGRSIAVFSGTVVALDRFRATIRISRVWKGKLGTTVIMDTGARMTSEGLISFTSCDFSYELGYQYLIFGYGEFVTAMRTGNCGPSNRLSRAEQTITMLNRIVQR